jgi:hypothetical protein
MTEPKPPVRITDPGFKYGPDNNAASHDAHPELFKERQRQRLLNAQPWLRQAQEQEAA